MAPASSDRGRGLCRLVSIGAVLFRATSSQTKAAVQVAFFPSCYGRGLLSQNFSSGVQDRCQEDVAGNACRSEECVAWRKLLADEAEGMGEEEDIMLREHRLELQALEQSLVEWAAPLDEDTL